MTRERESEGERDREREGERKLSARRLKARVARVFVSLSARIRETEKGKQGT